MSDAFDRLEVYVKRAVHDLRGKTLRDVQIETALTWCGRAVVASAISPSDAGEYGHEAVEHAALSGDDVVLRDVRTVLTFYGVRW